jgi:hypothetical protein
MAEKDPDFGKKCAFSGKAINRAKRYSRNGRYYLNKNSYKEHMKKLEEEKQEQEQSA